ncbi:hypothetical protein [Parasediminibacterium sp. JCM 36343]|uniref:hypothetical protein n=1 Tax=Parasediminibacterium sp. JCM 36343 TaxID=3374279 RepID=UPI00397E7962
MGPFFTYSQVQKEINELNLPVFVRNYANDSNLSLSALSKRMGKDVNFLSKQLANKNTNISLLYCLSQQLGRNLFEPPQTLLPENISTTTAEKALQQQIVDLQKQLADAQKEVALLKEVLKR